LNTALVNNHQILQRQLLPKPYISEALAAAGEVLHFGGFFIDLDGGGEVVIARTRG
jgi:hypothetical protein